MRSVHTLSCVDGCVDGTSFLLQYYAAVVLQGQKGPEGQRYLLHYEGTNAGTFQRLR